MGLPNRDSHGRFVHGAGSSGTRVNDEVITRVKAKLREHAKHMQAHRLTVGIHEAEGAKPKLDYNGNASDVSLIEVAAIHELRDRSWLRTWFDSNRSRLERAMIDAMRAEYGGDANAVERFGEMCARELHEWIKFEQGGLKALQPSTVAQKTAAGLAQPETPLFATGELVAAIKSMLDGGSP